MKYYLIDTLQTAIYNVCGLFYKLQFFKNFMKYFRNFSLQFSRKQNFLKFYMRVLECSLLSNSGCKFPFQVAVSAVTWWIIGI